MAAGHIEPNVGNFLLIGLVGAIGTVSVLAIAVKLKDLNIPVATPIADASLAVVGKAAA